MKFRIATLPAHTSPVRGQRYARRAAIEKASAPYLKLVCGHLTSREAAELYRVFAPIAKDIYCETCQDFRSQISRNQTIIPENPLF